MSEDIFPEDPGQQPQRPHLYSRGQFREAILNDGVDFGKKFELTQTERDRIGRLEAHRLRLVASNGAGTSQRSTHDHPEDLVALFAEEQEDTHDWIISGLLERADRLIVTGKEGFGKSTLLRQIGVCGALGLHPFTFQPCGKPLIIYMLDLENSKRQLRREFAKVMHACTPDQRATLMPRFYLASRVGGLQLDDLKDRDGDRAWVERHIAWCMPDIFLVGPLYKMIKGDPMEEVPSRNLALWLDKMRERYEIATVLEAHAPHGESRVYGWSGWKRWPEFGFHLDEEGGLSRWRGDREERNWPRKMRRGEQDEWLWNPTESESHGETEGAAEKAVALLAELLPPGTTVASTQLVFEAQKLGISRPTLYRVAEKEDIKRDKGFWSR